MAQKIETVNAQEDPTPEDENRIGTLSNVLKEAEITVGEPEDVVPQHMHTQWQDNGPRMVVIRVNESIEDMSVVAGGKRSSYTFEAGHQYRVPVDIAIELERLGKVWH